MKLVENKDGAPDTPGPETDLPKGTTDTPEPASEAAEEIIEEPSVDLSAIASSKVPAGMIESLKAIRHEIAVMHSHFVKEHGQIPSYLGGAYQAIDDAEDFLRRVTAGQEMFTPVPKKPEVKEADKVTPEWTIKVPSNLSDVPYMQEWAGTCFFPSLREMTVRRDCEASMQADKNKGKLYLRVTVTVQNKPMVVLPTKYKPNSVIDLAALAKSIDAL